MCDDHLGARAGRTVRGPPGAVPGPASRSGSALPHALGMVAAVLALGTWGGGEPRAADASAVDIFAPRSAKTALAVLSAEPEGANCPGGGTRVDAGVDSDGAACWSAEAVS